MIYNSLIDLIGNTPLLLAKNFMKNYELKAKIIVKLESNNPAGSSKDRVAKEMIEDAENRGIIKPGATIIEPTSGNTGIGLCALAVAKGYKAIIVMPDSMSKERIMLMEAYGAKVVLTPGVKGMKGAIEKAEEIKNSIPGSFIPSQFDNPANSLAHYKTTGPEIWNETEGNIDFFIAGIGTGGTISGTGKYLKEKNKNIKVIGVEPKSSPLITEGKCSSHKIQGIGANFIPSILDLNVVDEVIAIENEEAFECGKKFALLEGLLVGISSGAALSAAIKIASRKENEGKNIVVFLPDSGERYLSTELYK